VIPHHIATGLMKRPGWTRRLIGSSFNWSKRQRLRAIGVRVGRATQPDSRLFYAVIIMWSGASRSQLLFPQAALSLAEAGGRAWFGWRLIIPDVRMIRRLCRLADSEWQPAAPVAGQSNVIALLLLLPYQGAAPDSCRRAHSKLAMVSARHPGLDALAVDLPCPAVAASAPSPSPRVSRLMQV